MLVKFSFSDQVQYFELVERKGIYLVCFTIVIASNSIVEECLNIVFCLETQMLVLLDIMLAIFVAKWNGFELRNL